MSLETRQQTEEEARSDSSLGGRFYPLYRRLFDEDSDFVSGVEKKLAQARMADNVELFISRALAVGLIAGLGLWILGMLLGWLFLQLVGWEGLVPVPEAVSQVIDIIREPAILLVSGLIFGSIGFAIGFGSLISVPYFRAGARKREINILLADSVSFMYALSVGGMNQLEILRAMAKADDTYGEVAKEFQSIVLETEYFDTDYRTAIRNQALETPSDELSQFLTDMLSIVDSGGDMTDFLEDQKNKQLRTAQQEQKKQLDTLELFGEMYMTLSLFPLLLIIILVIMGLMGNGLDRFLLNGTVYGLIPLIGAAFLILVSTVTQDEIGDGYLRPEADEEFTVEEGIGVFNPGLVEEYTGDKQVFDQIKRREGTHELMEILRSPHVFFKDHPKMILLVTTPLTALIMIGLVVAGTAPTSIDGIQDSPVWGTFVWMYLPIYLNMLPLAIFHEWNVLSRKGVLGNLSENLRKLASANDTGMTLLESIKTVSETSSGKLSDEFETMHAKVNYGTSLKDALREFNNKYHLPRLSRTIKLISEAQEASSQIQDVLSTAAVASENQDEIARERKARTRMQMVIIIMTFLTLLAVMGLLRVQFLDTMASLGSTGGGAGGEASGQEFGADIETGYLSMVFFHAVTIQAVVSSFIAGYIRSVELMAGMKYAVILATITLITWTIVEQISSGGSEEAAALLLFVGSTGRSLLEPVVRESQNSDITGVCDE
ncbi:type II secretion system F family protein [Halovenus sp. HT40]|uniref:type II secretion system F family protein n=1 Tax=Halovenus sp. HT40 TaxID=3126691 RepID=UPI00300EB346